MNYRNKMNEGLVVVHACKRSKVCPVDRYYLRTMLSSVAWDWRNIFLAYPVWEEDSWLKIEVYPTLVFLKDGVEIKRVEGVVEEEALVTIFKEVTKEYNG